MGNILVGNLSKEGNNKKKKIILLKKSILIKQNFVKIR